MKIILKTKSYVVIHKSTGQDYQEASDLIKEIVGTEVFPVHRLDKDTCGLMLYALNRQRASDFVRQFKEKKIKKTYLALAIGVPPQTLLINKPLKKNKSNETEFAQTKIEVLARKETSIEGEKYSLALIKCEPLTGRYHQIRRHLKMIDCPIIGDEQYGNPEVNRFFRDKMGVHRTLLSAYNLEFIDPVTRKKQALKSNPDPDFAKVLKKLDFNFRI